MAFHIESQVFRPEKSIPIDFSGEGKDESPPLKWADVPRNAKELVLICEDSDAPRDEPFVHWVAYKIPASLSELPAAVPKQESVKDPIRFVQGKNSFGKVGYNGPMPPRGHGVHHYHFKLYALDQELPIAPGADKEELMRQMTGHIIDETELIGTYVRQ